METNMLYDIFMFPFTVFMYGFSFAFWLTLVGGIYAVLSGNYYTFRNPIVKKTKYEEDEDDIYGV